MNGYRSMNKHIEIMTSKCNSLLKIWLVLSSRQIKVQSTPYTNVTFCSGSDTTIKAADYPSIITSKVTAAVSNFIRPTAGYIDAVIHSVSLKEYHQGTSVNESWHKFLKKSSPFYSGSCSFELMVAIITHLQFLFNYK